jgi:(1->4)-alpha-D-glucan 1-alpha-D-glucosylmutase
MAVIETELVEQGQAQRLEPHIPLATYRLQFNRQFTFARARWLAGYLHMLGVSDVYASPYFQARAESTHGYDIANHNALNPSIGTREEYEVFVAELRALGMGQLLDVVPNHMGIGEASNFWWMDVLENGPSSIYAPFFDIDWRPIKGELENKVLLPILGQQYGRVLEGGELKLRYDDGAFFLDYYQTTLPVNPRTYVDILSLPLDDLLAEIGPDHDDALEYQSIITALNNLPARIETDRARVLERNREKEIIKRRLGAVYAVSEPVQRAIARALGRLNGAPGDPRSFDLLDALVGRQSYRLAYWRVAAEEINYRRFFDINDLAAIRMEQPEVFAETHRMLLELLRSGAVTGLRLDHPDGLWNPAEYFQRLQEHYAALWRPEADDQRLATSDHQAPTDEGAGTDEGQRAKDEGASPNGESSNAPTLYRSNALPLQRSTAPTLYLLVEKILGRGEVLPRDWPVHGTTGYDFMNDVAGVLVDASAQRAFDELYSGFIGQRINFEELVYTCKKQIMAIALASEVNVLAHRLARIAEHNRYYRDFTLYSLRTALREVIACFPIYRTYIVAERDEVTERDQNYITIAIARAKRRNPAQEPSIFDFLGDILRLRYPDTLDPQARQEQREFVMKFQQLTGPVMAKGLEDTAFYIYNRLVALNEVGGEPQRFGISPAAFHRQNQERLREWPHSMLATSTHDTKRSEDVRARLCVLSELPQEWRRTLGRWSRLNASKKQRVDGELAPDANEEYLIYQTLLGTWPFQPMDAEQRRVYTERVQAYLVKAMREAKVHTSWLNPNQEYDQAVQDFVAAVIADRRFVKASEQLRRAVAQFGIYNSLSQQLLKLTSPGVPDIYQGTEMWDFSMVDPDNRRPVDYDLRRWLLAELQDMPGERAAIARMLYDERESGRIKLYLTGRALQFRRDHADLYRLGGYAPLEASGDAADHIVAFARVHAGAEALTVAPRLLAKRLGGDPAREPLGARCWGEALLILPGAAPGQRYRNIFTAEQVEAVAHSGVVGLPLAQVLSCFPVALLARETPEEL